MEKMSEVTFFGKQLKLNKEEDAVDVVKAIEEAEDLETLILSGNTCGVEACKAIGTALSTKQTFKRAMWRDIFTGRLIDEIPQCLENLGDGVILSNAKLTELDLSDNAFGPNGIKGAVNLLSSPACFSLKILTLNNNGLGIGGAKILSRALLNCHQAAADAGHKFALEEFTSGRNRLENEGAKMMAEVFEVLGTLTRVSMTQNGINHPGISALAKALAKNTNLQVLDLNDNTFTAKGAAAIAEAFPMLNQLKIVNFGDCLLRSDGAKEIAQAIQEHLPNLEEINLGYNEMNGEAALAIATALANKPTMKRLELNGNSIGETNVELIKQVLEAKGHEDILGTLSDDEGDGEDDDEDEQEDDSESDENDEPSEEVPVAGVASEDSVHEPTTFTVPQHSPEVSIDTYWNNPTIDNLLVLPSGKRANLIATKIKECNSADKMELSQHFVRMTACCKIQEEQTAKAAIFEVIEKAFEDHLNDLFMNCFLEHVGLIKSEDKTLIPTKNTEGPIIVMTHLAQQNKLPQNLQNQLKLFLFKDDSFIHKQLHLKQYLEEHLGTQQTVQ